MKPVPKPVLVSAPATLPVGLDDVKTFLRVDGTTEDDLINSLIKAATQRLEKETNRKFVTQTWDVFYDAFGAIPDNEIWWDGSREGAESMLYKSCRSLDMPFGPLQSVTYLKVFNDDDTEETFDSSNYQVDTAGNKGAVALRYGASWPANVLRPKNGIVVRGVFGFGLGYIEVDPGEDTPSTIPIDIQTAIKIMVAKLYENRGDAVDTGFSIPATALAILGPYMDYRV